MAQPPKPLQKIFATADRRGNSTLAQWQEFLEAAYMPSVVKQVGDRPVKVAQFAGEIGGLYVGHTGFEAVRMVSTPQTLRRPRNMEDKLILNIQVSGSVTLTQEGRTIEQAAGSASICDTARPLDVVHSGKAKYVSFHVPHRRLENLVGSARNFTSLLFRQGAPATRLMNTFMLDLLRCYPGMSAETSERMLSIGMDLVTAGIAEMMAQEPPKSLQGTVAIQRAKAFIMANLGDPALDPSLVAAAAGVSLRHLQVLFKQHHWHVADWIWQRRLDLAAECLADAGAASSPLGELAYRCGFSHQAHFSRRFKERFGLGPRDFRRQKLSGALSGR